MWLNIRFMINIRTSTLYVSLTPGVKKSYIQGTVNLEATEISIHSSLFLIVQCVLWVMKAANLFAR